MANLAPTWRPKRLQNRGPSLQKSILKNKMFLAPIFQGFGPRFGGIFGCFFEGQIHKICKNFLLVQTFKIALLSRRNANFQDIEVPTKWKDRRKIGEKLHVFWDIDFEWILGGFGEGFGTAKSLIFLFFSVLFSMRSWECNLNAKKTRKKRRIPKSGGMCGARGKDFRMGGSLLQPQFQALP